MRPTSSMISSQIATLDATVANLRAHAAALSYEAVSGNRAAGDELAKVNSEIAGLVADRDVLLAARRRALVLEAEAETDALIDARCEHLASARRHAAAALTAAQAMDAAIAAFVAAAADLDAAEGATRTHYRLAGENPSGRVGREGAADHGLFLLARIADGTAKRRDDKTTAALVSAAWAALLAPQPEELARV